MIRVINNFSVIETKYGDNNFNDGSMELYFDGKSTGKKITGDDLKQQFEFGRYYIIIMYQDGAFECPDYLSVTLLNKLFEVERVIYIANKNVDLKYKDSVLIADDQIKISFTNGISVVLQIWKIPVLPLKPFLILKNWKHLYSK